jgi:integrase
MEEQEHRKDTTNIFARYYEPLAQRTRKRQWRELASLRSFLLDQGQVLSNLATDGPSWLSVKSSLVEAYVVDLKKRHYTHSSIEMQLYTIKTYARLAMEAGYLSRSEYGAINKIQAPPNLEGEPRRGEKKSNTLDLTDKQVQQLLDRPDTRLGNSNKLMLMLMLDYGLWPREIAALDRHSIDINAGTITLYNYHAEEQQTLPLNPQILETATRYLQEPSPYEALFVGNHKESTHTLRLTDRAINARVRTLGKKIGLDVLAPQDCHAYWEKTAHVRPTQRKRRPDILNRQAFEQSMLQHGVPDSMLAPFVSEYRLLIPLMVEFVDQQKFLEYLQKKLQDYSLRQENMAFLKEALEHIGNWMGEELEKYKFSRQEENKKQQMEMHSDTKKINLGNK